MNIRVTRTSIFSGQRNSHDEPQRRGMLLLLVVLMLALFMAIGSWLITVAMRSRASARAFSASSLGTSINESLYRQVLDEALLAALRGSPAAGNGSVAATGSNPATSPVIENLLNDKYGDPITGSASILATPNSTYMTLSLTSLKLPPVVSGTTFATGTGTVVGQQLNGRILTVMAPTGDALSFRVIGASGSATVTTATSTGLITCHVATPPGTRFSVIPSGTLPAPPGLFPAVVNGREFTPDSGASPPEGALDVGLDARAITPLLGSRPPENYDAYDDANIWLAEPVITSGSLPGQPGQLAFMNRVSFYGELFAPNMEEIQSDPDPLVSADVVDNDNDGVPDGLWIPRTKPLFLVLGGTAATPFPRVIPDRPSPLGGTIRFQVSYLILDLDGRININAAGASDLISSIYGSTPSGVPIGLGYGPADLDPSRLFPITLPTTSPVATGTTAWAALLKSGNPTINGGLPSINQRRLPPAVGLIEGRYALNGTPGVTGDDTGASLATCATVTGTTFPNYFSTVSSTSTFADLQGLRKVYMQPAAGGEISPTLRVFTVAAPLTLANAAAADATDDPYELRLDRDAPRCVETARLNASGTSPTKASPFTADNPLSLPELETILRSADADAAQLPQRLAAALAGSAQQARMTITTDSWDTPALTGSAAVAIENFLTLSATASGYLPLTYSGAPPWRTTGSATSIAVSPDIAAGLRFNVNRRLTTASDRYDYCKNLYTLVLMLRGTNAASVSDDDKRAAAQWAVNAVDFRDEDETITVFEYDTTILDGWNVDGNPNTTSEPSRGVVCGSERPDLVITETAASDGSNPGETRQLLVTLRRMPHTIQTAGTTGTAQVSGTSLGLTSPAWQLRFANNQIVRFPPATTIASGSYALFQSGSLTTISPSVIFSGSFNGGTNSLTSGPNAHVCVSPATAAPPFNVSGIPQYLITSGGTFALPAGNTTGTVFLERLADPTNIAQAGSAANPYIIVDQAPVNADSSTHSRTAPLASDPLALFWAANTTSWPKGGTTLGVFSGTAPWYHWPNRPFISQAELALVPTGTAPSYRILTDGTFPTSSLIHNQASIVFASGTVSGTASLGNLLLDATYVPSRFAGNSTLVSGPLVDSFGLDLLQSGSAELSKWREPGKVNVNTVVSGTSTAFEADDIVWAILMSGTNPPNLFAGKPRTRTQPANPGGPGVPATPATPGSKAVPGNPPRSIAQLLSLGNPPAAPNHYAVHQTGSTMLSGSSNGDRDANPFFKYSQAIRLANTATVRSQVFAVWISVKLIDDSPNAPPPVIKRLFAIVDRSIPVGYAPGRDLNVRDTIRLTRYLD